MDEPKFSTVAAVRTYVRGRRTWGLLVAMTLLCIAPTIWPGEWSHSPDEAAQDSIDMARPLMKFYDLDAARDLFGCPLRIGLMAIASLYLTPLLTLMFSFGSAQRALQRLGSEAGPGARRRAVLTEAVATTLVFGAMVAIAHTVAWSVAMAIGGVSLATMVLHEGLLLVAALSVAAACIPLWSVLNCLASPRRWRGLGIGLAVLVAFGIVRGLLHWRGSTPLVDLFPGSLDGVVLAGHRARGAIVPAVVAFWTLMLLLAANRLRSEKGAGADSESSTSAEPARDREAREAAVAHVPVEEALT